jgi:hypothetical protein
VYRYLFKLTLAVLLLPCCLAGEEPTTEQLKFFETRIRPLLVERCYECHSGDVDEVENKFQIDSRAGILRGGIHGPAAIPGMPEKSLLIFAVNHAVQIDMPPKFKLPTREIDDLTAWVKMGLPWPDSEATAAIPKPGQETAQGITDEDRQFWAFLPPHLPAMPRVRNRNWVSTEIDYFVLARLERAGMKPAEAASRRVLIRRATFDLTGLPPTPDEITRFLEDTSPDAYARLIDRLLASPAYGERWARHWLDVARYADSNGLDENLAHANAFRYRDYVVRAFNQDKTYDQFVREQLAGDLLPDDETESPLSDRIIATGFLSLGAKMLAEDDPLKMQMDIIDEQVDTLGRAFIGLTLGCARCHDHKFDPIPTADYYSLAGIFKSTTTMDNFNVVAKWHERPVASPEITQRTERLQAELAEVQEEIKESRAAAGARALENARHQVGSYLLAAQQLESIDEVLPASRTFSNDPDNLKRLKYQQFEAEAFTRGNVMTLTEGLGAGIGVLASREEKPGFVEYDIEVDASGLYQLELRYASTTPSPLQLVIDGMLVRKSVAGGVTEHPADTIHQFWENVAIVVLEPGKHVFRLESNDAFPHLDKLRLVQLAGSLEAFGKDAGTKDVTSAARGLLEAVTMEAETFQRGNVSRLADGYGAGIGAVAGSGGPNRLEYDITLPRPGTYHLLVRYAAADSRPTRISIGDVVISPAGLASTTGSWYPDTQTWEFQGSFHAATTSITLKFYRDGPISHLDRFLLLPGSTGESGTTPPDPELLARWREELKETQAQQDSVLATWHRAAADSLPLQLTDKSTAAEKLLLQSGPVPSLTELAARYQQVFNEAIRQWEARRQEDPESETMLLDPVLESYRRLLYDTEGPLAGVDLSKLVLDNEAAVAVKELEQSATELESAIPDVPSAMAVVEGTPEDLRIHLRGNHITLGEQVPRQFLQVLSAGTQTPVDDTQSGRLQLARWLTSGNHPLTARVMANRVWHWHFSKALVRSPDNFGRLGQRPTHPMLLDFLALKLQDGDWSLKSLHRAIMLSSTYQMSSNWNERYAESDPENKLLWRMNRRRLDAEEIRDSLLAVGDNLDRRMGGSLLPTKNRAYVTSTANIDISVYDSPRRSLYLPVVRSALYSVFQVFDFAEPSVPSGQRQVTNIASQALFIMNSKIVKDQSESLARMLLATGTEDAQQRIQRLYLQVLGRTAGEEELASCLAHLEKYSAALEENGIKGEERRLQSWQSLCRALLASNEFIYLD